MADVEPLSPELRARATDYRTVPSHALLDAFRSRGKAARRKLSDEIRAEANAQFTKAGTLKGAKARYDAYADAYMAYCTASACTEHAEICLSNAAAASLLNKQCVRSQLLCSCAFESLHADLCAPSPLCRFHDAVPAGEVAMKSMHRRLTEPATWAEARALLVRGFRDGMNLVVDEAKLARTEAQIKADNTLRWKILMRTARGHAGLLMKMMDNGRGVVSQDGQVQAYLCCQRAEKRKFSRQGCGRQDSS